MTYRTTAYAFGPGLQEGADPKMQDPGTPRRIRNLRWRKSGRLGVRREYLPVAMTSNLAFDLVATDLCKLNGRLYAMGGRIPGTTTTGPADLYEFVNLATFKWRSTDSQGQQRLCPATAVRDIGALPTQTAAVSRIDVAAANGLVCLVAEIGTSGTSVVHIFRASDDATILIEQVVCSRPRVCAVGNVFFITGVSTTSIILRRFNPASDETLATLTAAFGTGDAITAYDLMAEETGGFVVALARSTPTITIRRFTSAGAQTQQITGATVASDRIAVFSDGTTRVHVANKLSSGSTVTLYTYAISGGALQNGPTTLFSSATTQIQPGIARHSSTQIAITMGRTNLSILSDIRAEATHVNGGSQTWLGQVMKSKPGRYADANLVIAGQTQTNVGQRSNQLLAYSQELIAVHKDDLIGVDLDQEHMPQVARDAVTGRYYWPNAVLETGESGGRPVVTELQLMSTARRQTAELGTDLYIAGGTVQRSDGRQVVDCAFQETPEILQAASSAGSGSVSPGVQTAASFTTLPVDPPLASLNGLTWVISVDGGGFQTVTFGVGDTTPAAIAATINAATTGLTATVSGASVVITSDTTGLGSRLQTVGFQAAVETVLQVFGFFSGQTAVGTATPAIYQLAACWEWRDKDGKLDRSSPSPVVEVTMGGPTHNQIDVIATLPASARRNASNDEYGQAVRLVIFCSTNTQVNGGDFTLYRDVESLVSAGFSVAGTATVAVINDDATREEQEVLYTMDKRGALSGPLPFVAPLPAEYIAASANALLTGGLPHREQVQESRPLFPGESAGWADQIGAFKALTGDVLGVVRLDERRLALTARDIREMRGAGLDDAGFGDLGKPDELPTDVGVVSWQSLVKYRAGVMFQGRDTKIYRIVRGGSAPDWAGKNVEDTLAAYPRIAAAVYLPEDQTVCFACNNTAGDDGVILVWDVAEEQWHVDGPFGETIDSMVEYQGALALLIGGVVHLQSTSDTPTVAFIAKEWNGAMVHPNGHGIGGQVDRIQFFGTYRGNCRLTCTVKFGGGDPGATETRTFDIDGAVLGLSNGDDFAHDFVFEQTHCDRLEVDFLEEALSGAITQGLEWHYWGIRHESEGKGAMRNPTEQS